MNFLLIFHHFGSGQVPSEMHLADGQEPVAVGSCDNLTDNDTITGTHRPHYFAIAREFTMALLDVTSQQVMQVVHNLNSRLMKCLGFKTPNVRPSASLPTLMLKKFLVIHL